MTNYDKDKQDIIDALSTALLRWYPFKHGSRALVLGDSSAIVVMLEDIFNIQVTCVHLDELENVAGSFDYVICVCGLEKLAQPMHILLCLRNMLVPDGTMLLGMNNRLGLRYFCGDHDPYTGRCLDSIENYSRFPNSLGHMYARSEIETMLSEAGWDRRKFYSVLPRLEEATLIYADGQLPKEDLLNRLFPSYNHPQSLWLEEEPLYKYLADNGMFHAMANAYLIECSRKGRFADAMYVTSSMDRGSKNAMITVVHENGTVSKEAAYPDGEVRLRQMDAHMKSLQASGVAVIEGRMDNKGRYIMPYVKEVTGQLYLKELFFKDKDKFIKAMDAFREAILSSSPTHIGKFVDANGREGETTLFDRAYFDMVPLNSFHLNGKFVFFDQEFVVENCPVGVVVARMITTFYAGARTPDLERILPADVLYDRYGLLEEKQRWFKMEGAFLQQLRQEHILAEYNKKVRRGWLTVSANRQRMNYPTEEYRRLFLDIFQNTEGKKLILFGSGKYAKDFMDLYRVRYSVQIVVDNNTDTWGQDLHGITIQSPKVLKRLEPNSYKILICIKNFYPVIEQLDAMGCENYSVFDPGKSYAVPKIPMNSNLELSSHAGKKKYHVGYIAGVFDLFHIGHLNLLCRAKEQCDYLIVGVVSDRQVREYKKVEPFVPFEERLEMVRSCRYVDEAHEIPIEHPDTDMAWKLYHFDAQFSGSDYEHDPVWLAKKQWLEERGSTMVFFPYTQSTSSTKLKKLIDKHII